MQITRKINYENFIACAYIVDKFGSSSNPRPTQGTQVGCTGEPSTLNTTNGEQYDPPNRLNGCATAGGDG